MRITGQICMLLWIFSSGLFAQNEKIYDLLTKPATQRPLTLYRGQLQLNAGYQHGLGTRKYDHHGTRLSFEESRANLLANDLGLELAYGIFDFIELSTAICYFSQTESLASVNYWNGDYLNEVSTNREIRGPGHLDLMLAVRQPFFDSDFDFALWSGMSFPAFSQTPLEPEHSIVYTDPSDPNGPYNLQYLYKFKPAPNVSMWKLGVDTKLLVRRFAFNLTGFYKVPFNTEQTLLWMHTLIGDQFLHHASSYDRLPATEFHLSLTPSFQAFPWFVVFLSWTHQETSGGWTEESGSRLMIPQRSLGSLSPGFEILVSSFIRFAQYVDIPLYGRSTYAMFSIRSGISFNLVPLKAHYR